MLSPNEQAAETIATRYVMGKLYQGSLEEQVDSLVDRVDRQRSDFLLLRHISHQDAIERDIKTVVFVVATVAIAFFVGRWAR